VAILWGRRWTREELLARPAGYGALVGHDAIDAFDRGRRPLAAETQVLT
jgi:hypothetical protein